MLLSAPEGELLAVMKDGTVGFRRDDSLEFSFGVKLPAGKKVKVEIVGEPEKTSLFLDGQPAGTAVLKNFSDKSKFSDNFKHRPQSAPFHVHSASEGTWLLLQEGVPYERTAVVIPGM
ncbi:MAG: hypothetical protein ACLSUW_03960 [Akkermansia sp.]